MPKGTYCLGVSYRTKNGLVSIGDVGELNGVFHANYFYQTSPSIEVEGSPFSTKHKAELAIIREYEKRVKKE